MTIASGLYVIEQVGGTERLFWACSAVHGSGWTPKQPKQAFSKSEVLEQIRWLIENEWFPKAVIVRELSMD